jgi:DNA polymerase elongation subunit (family B)
MTDSNYIHFPHLKEPKESWEYAEMVAKEVSKLFLDPIRLEYEEVIYWRFFILTKKRYMYLSCGIDGIVDKVVGKKGVLLARRDCSAFVRNLYERVVEKLFDRVEMEEILYFIILEINKLCSNSLSIKDFSITKGLGSIDNGNLVPFITEKNEKKLKMGNYILKPLPTDEKERQSQIRKKDAIDAKDYYMKCLPAIVQLADKMRRRGKRVDPGSRLEYVIIDNGVQNDKQYNKVEDIDYFNDHNSILKIDFMYYLKLLTNPLDQVLNIAFNKEKNFKKDFILYQYDFRNKNRRSLLQELNNLFKPKLIFNN